MQPGGWESDEYVTGHNRPTVDHPGPLDDADDEPGDVVFAVGVEPRHLRSLAAQQRAAAFTARLGNTANNLLGHGGVQPAGREVIEKEQRLGALHQDVADAVVGEVGAYGA